MKCECGNPTVFLSHFAQNLAKAHDWSHMVTMEHLPVRIDRDECAACGRVKVAVFDKQGHVVERRG